jgi:steroid delta-isomerase
MEKLMAEVPKMASGMAPEAPKGPPAAHIRDVFTTYGALQSAGDVDGILALFADEAVVRDPANAPAHHGKAALRTFFEKGFAASGGANEMKLEGAVRIAGNQAAAAFIVRTVRSRPIYRVDTLDVMSFDDAGLITEMVAYWGPENFAQED